VRVGVLLAAFSLLSPIVMPTPTWASLGWAPSEWTPPPSVPRRAGGGIQEAHPAGLPRLQAEVDTAVVTVGDPITLRVSVEHAPASRVAWPDSVDLSPFEVLGARTPEPRTQGDLTRSSLTLTLAAYELGDLEIPPFRVAVIGAQGDTTLLATNRFGIRVESVGLEEGEDIRGLKGPLGIPLSPTRIAAWVLGLLLAGALGAAVYRRLARKGEGPRAPVPAAPARPPHEVALEALSRLEASPLLERGEVKEYHIQVSEILRRYVEGRFRVQALEMTTRDVLAGMEKVGVEAPIRERFRSFLDRCDMVKFAKQRPDAEASREVLALGRRLVEETILEDEPVVGGAGADSSMGSGREDVP